MKKSNKLTMFYVIVSLVLFVALLGGGAYGVYLSVGFSFVRSNIENVVPNGAAINVAYGGASAGAGSSTSVGVVIVSIILIILAILDFVSLVKQIVFFKQFKPVKDSVFENCVEKKIKSKKSVVVFACVVDILSILAGGIGLFVNTRGFVGGVLWVLFLIDGAVCLFALVSIVLLLIKLKKVKDFEKENIALIKKEKESKVCFQNDTACLVDRIEYFLLKLKHLKSSRMITVDEYDVLRKMFFEDKNLKDKEDFKQEKNKEN